MAQISTNEFRSGVKIELDGQPFEIVSNEFVKPGKGQAFNRVKVRGMLNGRTFERTFKSGDKVDLAEIHETKMRMLYSEQDGVVFMNEATFEQLKVMTEHLGSAKDFIMEDTLYDIVLYKGEPISVVPPTFMDLKITQTDPGARGDTAAGKVLKPAVTETGAKISVPIFIDQDEMVKVDTRTGEYVSRSTGDK